MESNGGTGYVIIYSQCFERSTHTPCLHSIQRTETHTCARICVASCVSLRHMRGDACVAVRKSAQLCTDGREGCVGLRRCASVRRNATSMGGVCTY